MEWGASKGDPEGSQVILHSLTHEARWEVYLMAEEITRSFKEGISNLDKSVRAMREELQQLKDAT